MWNMGPGWEDVHNDLMEMKYFLEEDEWYKKKWRKLPHYLICSFNPLSKNIYWEHTTILWI